MHEHSKSLGWGRVSQNGIYAAVYASPPRAIDWFLVGVALDDGHELWEVPNEPQSRPAISRDATRVAFDDQEARIIHIYDVPSRELKALRIHGENPAWDPQSHRLAYDDGVNTIVYDVASETSFSIGAGTEPSWSADGESIAVRVGPTDVDLPFISVRTNPGDIDLLNLKTGSRRQLVPASSYIVPRWSPDGEWMIYTRRGHASTVGAAAPEPQTIVIRNTKSGAEMSLGDVPGKANPIDYTWVDNERLCRPSGG